MLAAVGMDVDVNAVLVDVELEDVVDASTSLYMEYADQPERQPKLCAEGRPPGKVWKMVKWTHEAPDVL